MSDILFEDEERRQPQGFTLDFKRVIARAIRFWYVTVFLLTVALTIAFYKNRYSQRVYPVSASIMIRETKEVSGAELLYNNPLVDAYRNYLNEPFIIKSYPLLEKVIHDLNFHVTFYREGYFMTTEAYNYVPVTAQWCDPDEIRTGQFIFRLKDETHYTLSRYTGKESTSTSEVFQLNDSIQYKEYSLCIKSIPGRDLENYIGVPFLLIIQNPRSVASSYIGRLRVDWAESGAGIINLSLTGTNPEKEIDFLNGLIRAYRERDLENKNETAERTLEFIKKQMVNIKDSLGKVEFELRRFGNNSIKDMSQEAQRLFNRVEGFEVQKAELLIRQNYYDYLNEYLTKNEANLDLVVLPSSVGLSDPVIASLLTRMVDLQLELKLYIDPERAKNPLVADKMKKINEIKQNVRESLKTLQSTDKIKMDFIKKQTGVIDRQLALLPGSERQMIAVQRNYALLENLYVFLIQKLSEVGITKASNTSDIIPVNPPMQGGVIFPKPVQNYTIAVVIGLILPVIIFILFELSNNKVQSKEDIDKMTSIPFIGGVGHNSSGNNLAAYERPKSAVAESFRALRSNLNFFTGNQPKKIFMVSSSISGEGKTFTTINLATVFALSGKKTLIVGADMRRPKIFQDFDKSNDQGLSTFLSGISEFDQVVQPTIINNLFFVSGGPVPPNPSELLLTDKFDAFMKLAKDQFDFVLIDTPPLALVTDAFVMSKFTDHTIFVMRQNYSPKDFVRSIDEYYRSGKIKNISILLNDIYKSGLGYGYGPGYAYQYGYAYGYGNKDGYGYYEEQKT